MHDGRRSASLYRYGNQPETRMPRIFLVKKYRETAFATKTLPMHCEKKVSRELILLLITNLIKGHIY